MSRIVLYLLVIPVESPYVQNNPGTRSLITRRLTEWKEAHIKQLVLMMKLWMDRKITRFLGVGLLSHLAFFAMTDDSF